MYEGISNINGTVRIKSFWAVIEVERVDGQFCDDWRYSSGITLCQDPVSLHDTKNFLEDVKRPRTRAMLAGQGEV